MGTYQSGATVKVIASEKSWVEGEAIRQLQETAAYKGMVTAVGMPDLHPGKGNPVGAAFLSDGWIYPHLVGNDIGCGMGLWQTDMPVRKLKPNKVARKLKGLDSQWDGDRKAWLDDHGLHGCCDEEGLGTIGGGNHFAEFLSVQRIEDAALFEHLDLDVGKALLLVHSGSRGIGDKILRNHVSVYGARGLQVGSDDFEDYLAAHDKAVDWAVANRNLIADRFMATQSSSGRKVLDLCHNSVVAKETAGQGRLWLHRKGAAPSQDGPVIIPGSRGSLSYLVQPMGDQSRNLWSVAHGAGRKWKRSECKARLSARFRPEDLERNGLDGVVVCENRDLLYEEAPQSYKDINQVVNDLVSEDIVRVIATLRPMVSYKTRRP